MLYLNLLTALLFILASFMLIHKLMIAAFDPSKISYPQLWVVVVAEVLLAYSLVQSTFVDDGLNISFFNVTNWVAFFVCALYVLTTIRRSVEIIGIVILPLTAASVLVAVLNPSIIVISSSFALQAHILLSLISYSILTVAALQSVVVAVQNSVLRKNPSGAILRTFPALESMEHLLFQMIALGFVLLTLSLLSGLLFVEDFFAQHLVHKTFFSIIAWMVFLFLLWGRFAYGWRGKKAIKLSLGGFILLMLAYFGSKFVTEFILHL